MDSHGHPEDYDVYCTTFTQYWRIRNFWIGFFSSFGGALALAAILVALAVF